MSSWGDHSWPYDETLASRIRDAVGQRSDVSEKKMFGGIAFLLGGKMFVGVVKDELMVRVGPERHAESVKKPHARTMEFTGRPMNGYVFVAAGGCRTVGAVKPWVELAAAFVVTLDSDAKRSKKRAAVGKKRSSTKP